jgi:hypothetical protein
MMAYVGLMVGSEIANSISSCRQTVSPIFKVCVVTYTP